MLFKKNINEQMCLMPPPDKKQKKQKKYIYIYIYIYNKWAEVFDVLQENYIQMDR